MYMKSVLTIRTPVRRQKIFQKGANKLKLPYQISGGGKTPILWGFNGKKKENFASQEEATAPSCPPLPTPI